VRLAREYGVPVYGCFGSDMAGNEGPDTLRLHLSKGYPLVVVSRMNLIPDSVGHAQCIAGIDGDNNVLIHDPYSSISHRQKLDRLCDGDLGQPVWERSPGKFVASWKEFDMCWNTVDTDFSVPDYVWDTEGISDQYKDKEWRRFWLCVYPK